MDAAVVVSFESGGLPGPITPLFKIVTSEVDGFASRGADCLE